MGNQKIDARNALEASVFCNSTVLIISPLAMHPIHDSQMNWILHRTKHYLPLGKKCSGGIQEYPENKSIV